MQELYDLIKSLTSAINRINTPSFSKTQFLLDFIPSVVSILALLVSIFMVFYRKKEDFKLKKRERLQLQLEEFYYPYLLLTKKNEILANLLKKDKNANSNENGNKEFRTLIALLDDNYTFSVQDSSILDEIVCVDKQLNELIIKGSKYINDNKLRENLVGASCHFTIITMIRENNIKGEINRFSSYVYPQSLCVDIEKKIKVLEKELTRK